MSLIAWENVTQPKSLGGLGVKNLETMNQALLTKIMWKQLQNRRPPQIQIAPLQNPATRPWEMQTAIPFWKALKELTQFKHISVSFTLGDGTQVGFWQDQWMRAPLKNSYQNLYYVVENKEITEQQASQLDQ